MRGRDEGAAAGHAVARDLQRKQRHENETKIQA
jgi:hypothetical protein